MAVGDGGPTRSLAYVREVLLTQRPAPRSQTGVTHWVRENLFSSWVNGLSTIVCVLVIYMVLAAALPWLFRGVWEAESLSQCRAIMNDIYGNTNHACWAVIRERWTQLLYGFFPASGYWRANLAFVLMLLAIAPILFDTVPRRLIWLTIAFPFLLVWLVWGGPIWDVLSVACGFFLSALAFKVTTRFKSMLVSATTASAVALFWWTFVGPAVDDGLATAIPFGSLQDVQSRDLGGFMISVIIGISGIALSLPLGIVLALGRQSDLPLVRFVCTVFIEFIRGVPLITLLFAASLLLNYFLPPGTTFDLTLRVIIMVTLFSSSYMAEVIRGGLAALPKGQYEAADALGFDYQTAQRLIILPQVLKISIPGIVNIFISLFKDTSLVMFIGIYDMLGLSKAIRANGAWNGIHWELFIFIGVVFWICTFAMSRYSQWLERKLRTEP